MAPKTQLKMSALDDSLIEFVIEEAMSHLDADEKFPGTSFLDDLMPQRAPIRRCIKYSREAA